MLGGLLLYGFLLFRNDDVQNQQYPILSGTHHVRQGFPNTYIPPPSEGRSFCTAEAVTYSLNVCS